MLINTITNRIISNFIFKTGKLRVNGQAGKSKDKLLGGELLELDVIVEAEERWLPQPIPLNIVFSDEHIIVINKLSVNRNCLLYSSRKETKSRSYGGCYSSWKYATKNCS